MDNQSFKSTFCSKSKAISSLESIIRQADFKYIVLSYNDEGIIGLDQIEEIMSKYGDYYRLEKPYKRFKSSTIDGQKSNTIEYLHCLIKRF